MFFELLSKTQIVSGSLDRMIKIWDLNNGECLKTFNTKKGVICMVKINNCQIAYSGITIIIMDLISGDYIKSLNGQTKVVSSLIKLSKNKIVSGSNDYLIKIWDLTTANCILTLNEHKNFVSSLVILNNSHFISGSFDTTIKV